MPEDSGVRYLFPWEETIVCVTSEQEFEDFFWMERQWWWAKGREERDGG